MSYFPFPQLSEELLSKVSGLVRTEQEATREIVIKLGEVEAQSAHLEAGYSSLFGYATIELGYSDDAAMRRIKAARCLHRYPKGKELLLEGKLNLTTASPEFEQTIERMEQLLCGKYGRPSLSQLFQEAMDCYIRHNDPVEKALRKQAREKKAALSVVGEDSKGMKAKDGKHTRYIPSDVYIQVLLRDKGQCTFVAPDGRRCDSRQCQVDHIEPFALGGASDDPENLRLLCKSHNLLEAERVFGREHMQQFRRAG